MSNTTTQAKTPTVFTTDLAINLLSVVKRNNERFYQHWFNALSEAGTEVATILEDFSYYNGLKSRFEAELEEYVETGEYGHFNISEKEGLDIADIYQDLQIGADRFTINEINWFAKVVRYLHSGE